VRQGFWPGDLDGQVDPARPDGRLLLLNSAQHSYVDLSDPEHLEFAYAKWMGAFVDESGDGSGVP